jgi:hypothetical protein
MAVGSDGTAPVRGICCSGGGIRSAAFSLGALQELSRSGKLEGPSEDAPDREGARYLAGVSGGAYIASAFTLAHRYRIREEPPNAPDEERPRPVPPPIFAEGSPEERYLRNRCSYLAAGLIGKLELVATVTTNFVANLLVLAAFLVPIGILLGGLYAWGYAQLTQPCVTGACPRLLQVELDDPMGRAVIAFLVLAALASLTIIVPRIITASGRWHRQVTVRCSAALAAAVGMLVVLYGLPQLLFTLRSLTRAQTEAVSTVAENPQLATGVGLTAALLAALSQVAVNLRNVRSLQHRVEGSATWYRSLGERAQKVVVALVGTVAGPLAILAALVLVVDTSVGTDAPQRWVAFAVSAALLLAVWRFSDLTAWSLHPFYKRKLATAFAVRRVDGPQGSHAEEIPYDDPLPLSECTRERIEEHTGYPFPELRICAAVNVSDGGMTPPGSAVTSFVFSPTEVGGPPDLVGRVPTLEYEDLVQGHRAARRRRGRLTVPAAVAVAAAAIAPSMGRKTRGSLRFLFALANLRLGIWLPNPRHRAELSEDTPWRRLVARPVPRAVNLLKEVVGHHTLKADFLYVTDGGHYENLGLVELLRLGCTEIYCLDASDDGTPFAALGEAIAIARTDVGVEIEIEPGAMRLEGSEDERWMRAAARQHVIGTYTTTDGRPGRIAYIRPAVTPRVPWDVRAYAEKDEVFPSNPTTSQLYTGERFEAYRVLGVHGAREAIAAMDAPEAEEEQRSPGPTPPAHLEAPVSTTVVLSLPDGVAPMSRGHRTNGGHWWTRRPQRSTRL